LKLRYLIGKDADPGTDDSITVIGYDATTPPKNGAKYINLRDELNSGTYGPYLPADDIDDQYNEPAPDPEGKGFWENLNTQLDRAKSQGFTAVELDNCDTFSASVVLLCYQEVARRGLTVWAKNPALVDGNREAILAHSAVVGVIVERDCGTPTTYDAMRRAVGKPDLPIRFVSYGGGKQWAQQTAGTIQAADYSNMGVTYSSEGEYGNAEDVLLPKGVPMAEPAWLTEARASIGKYGDADAPKLAREVAAKYPDMAAYAAQATGSTPWCGIFWAAMLARAGIRPPYDKDNIETDDFMWADAPLEAKWGTVVSRGDAKPGDTIVLRTPHHITFFDGNNGSNSFWGIGGNQSNAVTRASFSWDGVRAVVRSPSVAAEKPPPVPMSNRFAICLKRVLKHEGGNDDDPRDPGGRTSRGITAARWAEWRQTHPGLPADVWDAPQAEVEAIYLEKYWQPLWCDMLPPGVDYAVFDFGVNSGPARSAKFLQEIVGSAVDGEVGPNTVAATKEADPEEVINALCDNRMFFLKGLSTWGTFGNGWTNRVNDVRRDALADAEAAPVPEPDDDPIPEPIPDTKPKSIDEALARIDAAVADIRELARVANQPAPQVDWAKIIQPILAEIAPKILPLILPYIIQMLPQLLPYILGGLFQQRQSVMSKPGVQASAAGGIGAIIGALASQYLSK
jgi:lysozyme family protein